MTTERPYLAQRFRHEGTNVWSVFTPLANAHQAVNLGQGFPDLPVAPYLKDAVAQAVQSDSLNQYSPVLGLPRLRRAIAKDFSMQLGRTLEPNTEVLVCQGATEGTVALFLSILNPGDEVILIEPFYDMYPSSIMFAGGVAVYVPLHRITDESTPSDATSAWRLDMSVLRKAITRGRTKAILLNTPHNPVGKVYTHNELVEIAQIAHEFDLIVVSDEVYDRLLYDGVEHVSIASLPGMWDRTVTIGSAGKTFSVTGWKVGWLIGPPHLISGAVLAHQRIAFCVATPLQEAVAVGFEDAHKHNFFHEQQQTLMAKRQTVLEVFDELSIPYFRPQGAYFVLFNTNRFNVPIVQNELRDWSVCKALTRDIGVAAIPPSAFYSEEHTYMASSLARFCFCKTDTTLTEGMQRLRERLPSILL